jgi:hypothetical protein
MVPFVSMMIVACVKLSNKLKSPGRSARRGRRKEEGRRRKEEGGRRKEEGGKRRKEEGGRRKEERGRSEVGVFADEIKTYWWS